MSLRGFFTRTANPESTLRPPALVTLHRREVTSFPGKQPERKVSLFGTRQGWHSGEDSSRHGGQTAGRLNSRTSGFLLPSLFYAPTSSLGMALPAESLRTAVCFAHLLARLGVAKGPVPTNVRPQSAHRGLTTCYWLDPTAPSGVAMILTQHVAHRLLPSPTLVPAEAAPTRNYSKFSALLGFWIWGFCLFV